MTLLKAYYAISAKSSRLTLGWLRLLSRVAPTVRVRVVIINESRDVLLVREVIDPYHWSLPGGGVARRESPVAAARREVREELGLDIAPARFDERGSIVASRNGANYDIVCFVLTIAATEVRAIRASKLEIRELRWVSLDALPGSLSAGTRVVLGQLRDSSHI